ncbi:hypothetical protein E1B28_009498 [Marasmius oreades]|uniref:Uncharacterized protein n=1 Tax=Marasmius oreades TaxID=181124 RepID=A0A9P7USP2_9AGAR|nr:uncharacterized protein E1B28_009498 [Marasmius oreades]KAG7090379.1 hypothetical protein E1B28_009498 [Marasmius oreades]
MASSRTATKQPRGQPCKKPLEDKNKNFNADCVTLPPNDVGSPTITLTPLSDIDTENNLDKGPGIAGIRFDVTQSESEEEKVAVIKKRNTSGGVTKSMDKKNDILNAVFLRIPTVEGSSLHQEVLYSTD